MTPSSSLLSLIWRSPSASMTSCADLPLENIFANTCLPSLPDSVPLSTSATSSPSFGAVTGESPIDLPAAFKAPMSSP